MACDNLCGFKKNGWHDTACPESDDSISRDDRKTIETLREHVRILREALEAINKHPTNGNSEPDSMAEALEQIHALAKAALEATKEDSAESIIKTLRDAILKNTKIGVYDKISLPRECPCSCGGVRPRTLFMASNRGRKH